LRRNDKKDCGSVEEKQQKTHFKKPNKTKETGHCDPVIGFSFSLPYRPVYGLFGVVMFCASD